MSSPTPVGRPATHRPGARPVVPGLETLGELGRGAHGTVYRVRRDGTDYALKVTDRPADDDPTAPAHFRREAAMLAAVGHPGLPRIHEVGTTGGRPYLVMDLVSGTTLADTLARSGPLTVPRAAAMAADMAAVLAAMHRHGLVHRDVTPGNIMLPPHGPARLIDFGLTARDTGAYDSTEQPGTPHRPVDGRSDLYSLGVVLYEAVTGSRPFDGDDLSDLLRMHTGTPAPDPRLLAPELPDGPAAVIATLLAKDPDDRYSCAEALLADLHRLAADPAGPFIPARATPYGPAPAGPMIGNTAALRRLTTRWHRAAAGAGEIVVLRGAPGSGRGRLADELAGTVRAAGGLVLHGSCATDDPTPLAPWRDAFAGLLAGIHGLPPAERDEALRRLRAAVPDGSGPLAGLHPALAGPAAPAGSARHQANPHDQARLTLAVAALLARLARTHGGLLLRLDDVQWLDEPGRRVLAELAAGLDGTPILMLVTIAETAATPDGDPGADIGAALGSAELASAIDTTIELAPLTDREMARLLTDRLPGMRIGARLAGLLRTRAQGNPFSTLEYLRAIIDAGLLWPHWGEWLLDDSGLARLELSDDALDVVLARVHGLDPATRAVLRTAATIGPRFGVGTVLAAGGLPADRAVAALTDAAGRRLIETRHRGDEYAFVHDRIREALLGDLDAEQRAALHQRVAETMHAELMPGGRAATAAEPDPARLFTVATHYVRGRCASTPIAAFHACLAAGRAALAGFAPSDAVGYLRQAAALGVPATSEGAWPPVDEAAFRLLYGTALRGHGEYAEALRELHRARLLATDRLQRARILAVTAEAHQGDWNPGGAVAAARAGLAELGGRRPRGGVVFVLSSLLLFLAGLLIGTTRIAFGRVGFGRAGQAERERHRVAIALGAVGSYAATATMNLPLAGAFSLRVLYAANRLGPSVDYCIGLLGAAGLAGSLGLRRIARRFLSLVDDASTAIDDPRQTANAALQRGMMMWFTRADDGQTALASLEHGAWQDPARYCDQAGMLIWTAAYLGRTAEALRLHDLAGRRVAGALDPDETQLVVVPAQCLALTGRTAEAAAEWRRVAVLPHGRDQVVRELTLRCTELYVRHEEGELGAAMDDAITATTAALAGVPSMVRPSQPAYVLIALTRLAQLRAATDDGRPAALARARQALRTLDRVWRKAPETVAFGLLAHADLEVQLGRPERAEQHLRELRTPIPDAPVIAFEAARVRTRLSAALGNGDDAHRQAHQALAIAHEQRWPHRERWVRAEFGVTLAGVPAGRTARRSATGTDHAPGRSVATGLPAEPELRRLRALAEVSRVASRTVDPDELARVVLDTTIRILAAERALLFLVPAPDEDAAGGHHSDDDCFGDGGDQPLIPQLGRDASGATIEAAHYSTSLVERVRHSGQPLVITGTEEGAALGAQRVDAHDLRSILIAPLRLDGRLVGVVYLDSRLATGIFTADDAATLAVLTTHIATALQTARTARRQARVQAVRRRHELAEALCAAQADMSATLCPDGVLDRLRAAATGLLPCRQAVLLPVTADLADALDRPWIGSGAVGTPGGPGPDAGLPARIAEAAGGAASWLTVPLATRGGPLGVLLLTGDTPGALRETDLVIAGTLAAQAAAAYQNATLFAEVARLAGAGDRTGAGHLRQS